MLEWTMTHPWMTLVIIIVALAVIDSVAANICRAINNGYRTKLMLNGIEPKAELLEEGKRNVGNNK